MASARNEVPKGMGRGCPSGEGSNDAPSPGCILIFELSMACFGAFSLGANFIAVELSA